MLYQAARQRGARSPMDSRSSSSVQPLDSEVGALKAHRATIEQGLRAEFANFNRLTVIGSHTRDSAIKIVSDVDTLRSSAVATSLAAATSSHQPRRWGACGRPFSVAFHTPIYGWTAPP
jgi:hypothetical protein